MFGVLTTETHHVQAEPSRKKKPWLPILIVVGVLIISLPILAIIAAIAIPNVISIKKEADAKAAARMTASIPSPPKPAHREMEPARTPIEPPAILVNEVSPAKSEVKIPSFNSKEVDLTSLKLEADAPVWSGSNSQNELRSFLVDLWNFEALADDPFFELSESILTQILEKRGPIEKSSEMALYVLPRKLEEYPHLGCAALTILAPNDRGVLLTKLDTLIPKLNDPMLALQMLAQKAEYTKVPTDYEQALKAFEMALNTEGTGQIPDAIAFYILSERFLYSLPVVAPDRYAQIVNSSKLIPQWLKHYKSAEILWLEIQNELQRQNYRPSDTEAIKNSFLSMSKKLEASWDANPNHPAAAAKMIEVINGIRSSDLAAARMWFDRAVAAQADYAPAYSSYLKVLSLAATPQNPLGLKFAASCALTGRFDTMVPMILVDAHVYQNVKLNQKPSKYWASLSSSQISEFDKLFTGLNNSTSLVHDGVTEKSVAALTWFLIGDKEKAAECIKNLDRGFDFNAFRAFKMEPVNQSEFNDFLLEHS